MDQNRDWKPIIAIALAALALFIALGGTRSYGSGTVSPVPQQIIVQPAAPLGGQTGGAAPPVVTGPGTQAAPPYQWGGWHRGGPIFPFFALFPLLLLAGLIFLVLRVIGPRHHGWGGPGWYGRPWGGPGPGPQGPPQGQPYQQYPQGQSQGQPYGYQGYPQGQQARGGQPGQPTQATGESGYAQDDITRPQGSGD